jgi:hypothetical protein
MKNLDAEKLSDLMCMIPDAMNQQVKMTVSNPVRDGRYFDCEMYDWQSEPVEPEIVGEFAKWECMCSFGYASEYYEGDVRTIKIPAWLYRLYLEGRAKFISWRQVQVD